MMFHSVAGWGKGLFFLKIVNRAKPTFCLDSAQSHLYITVRCSCLFTFMSPHHHHWDSQVCMHPRHPDLSPELRDLGATIHPFASATGAALYWGAHTGNPFGVKKTPLVQSSLWCYWGYLISTRYTNLNVENGRIENKEGEKVTGKMKQVLTFTSSLVQYMDYKTWTSW